MAHKTPYRGGVKKKSNRLKSFVNLNESAQKTLPIRDYYDPLINRRVKEILNEKNRQ